MKKRIALVLLLLLSFQTFAAGEPRGISLDITEKVIDLATENRFQLSAVLKPEGASGSCKWTVSDSSVLSVDGGSVKALKPGEATVSVYVRGNSSLKATCRVKVIDSRAPERIIVYPSAVKLEPSQSIKMETVALPVSVKGKYVYKSANESVATVDSKGKVTLQAPGETSIAVISAYDSRIRTVVPVKSAYGTRITSIKLPMSEFTLEKGQTYSLTYTVSPQNASKAIVFSSSNTRAAKVDENGLVTALGAGNSVITVRSHRDPSVSASLKLTVTDVNHPDSIEYSIPGGANLNVGEEKQIQVSFLPSSAVQDYTLASSREDILSVDAGKIRGVARGVSVLTIQSTYIPELKAEVRVSVSDQDVCLEIPLRRTDKTGISDNLARIDRLRQTTLKVIQGLRDAGTINDSEAKKRAKIIENAFAMYSFPWTVDKKVYYWEKANSENGAKDFVPGVIYYGLPYTSGVNQNRNYNVKRALEQERYIKVKDENYYLLNRTSKESISGYAGNDCSSFVALAIWGYTFYNGEIVKTGTLYSDNRLKAFTDPNELRPGDILVRHSSHVVMFLYWADEKKTQAVFLQQGGSEKAINTVNAWVTDINYYTDNYYRLRRTVW
ncbi:MAG: Ig-like domain-containing protein [Clostridiales bacterium]|nr:Ig-like domain-containing protein [Clostridiales bacterium]